MGKPNIPHPSNGNEPDDIDSTIHHLTSTESDEPNSKAIKIEDDKKDDNSHMDFSVSSCNTSDKNAKESFLSATDSTVSESGCAENPREKGTKSLNPHTKRQSVPRHKQSFRNTAKSKRLQKKIPTGYLTSVSLWKRPCVTEKRNSKKPLKFKVIQLLSIVCRIFFTKKTQLSESLLSWVVPTLSSVFVYPCRRGSSVFSRGTACYCCRQMEIRENRLRSFQSANCPIDTDVDLLANSGFYYCIHQKKYLCYACGVHVHDLSRIPAHYPQCTHTSHNRHSDESPRLQNNHWWLDGVQTQRFNSSITQDGNNRNGSVLQASGNNLGRICGESGAIARTGTGMSPADNQSTGFENTAGLVCSGFSRLTIDETRRRPQRNSNYSLYYTPNQDQISDNRGAQEDEDICVIHRRQHPSIIAARTMWELRRENTRLRNQVLCIICGTQEKKVVFLPCHHLVTCENCSVLMQDCPVYTCRCKIENRTIVQL